MYYPKNSATQRRVFLRRSLVVGLLWSMAFYAITPLLINAQTGNIAPGAIEIDINANLYPGSGNANILNPGASLDWVKDNLANTDPPSLINSIATGIDPGVTGAAGGVGHWNGVRIVDGIGGSDQDIFLNGGKENDTTTWNVGPGSVGSAKYDVTQAFIANNQTHIFLGMERRGNNGTTAFDFEFNQFGTAGGYVPTRTIGDVLLTFEMQGSGGSGSADPHVFFWNGSTYVEQALNTLPAGLVTSINSTTATPAPWGYVDSGGSWVLSPNIPRFEFAEAQVPLSILPGVNACGGSAFVQVRTRSSSTANSDLKDATKIFQYNFGGPDANGSLTPSCDLTINYDGTASRNSSGGSANLTYSWQFQKLNTGNGMWENAGQASGSTGSFVAPSAGTYRAVLTVTESGGASCQDSTTTAEVDAFDALTAAASKTSATTGSSPFGDSGFSVNVTATTNAASGVALQWQRLSSGSWVDISGQSSVVMSRSLSNIFTDGTVGSEASATILGDNYSYRLSALSVRVHATRTINGCTADSAPVVLKALKAIDP